MDSLQLTELFNRYLQNKCSAAEVELLMLHFHTSSKALLNDLVMQELDRNIFGTIAQEQNLQASVNKVHENLKQQILTHKDHPVQVKRVSLWPRIAVAASVAFVMAAGGYLYVNDHNQNIAEVFRYSADIAPGRNTATLTLADGKTVTLSGAKKGVVIGGSKLRYNDGSEITPEQIALVPRILTAATPRGGTYQLTLPDGTKVWLNAASSLKFPSTFATLKKRSVALTGEAYFEVAKDKTHPFIVSTDQQQVEVLGTHFNISSYTEERNTKTTLLEGSVRIVTTEKTSILTPGQQATLTGNNMTIAEIEVEDAVAWKNGRFMFNYESLDQIMLELSRWYNIDVEYTDPSIKSAIFFGRISKYENVSKVLNMLERTGVVKFRLKGRTVVIDKIK